MVQQCSSIQHRPSLSRLVRNVSRLIAPPPLPKGWPVSLAASFGGGWGNRRLLSLNLSIIANYADVVTL